MKVYGEEVDDVASGKTFTIETYISSFVLHIDDIFFEQFIEQPLCDIFF